MSASAPLADLASVVWLFERLDLHTDRPPSRQNCPKRVAGKRKVQMVVQRDCRRVHPPGVGRSNVRARGCPAVLGDKRTCS
jgi:hypothetical protein